MENKLDIAWSAILKLTVAVAALYVLFVIKSILIWFVFAVVLAILFNPAIDFLQRRKVPRALGAIFIYFGFFGLISILVYMIIPIFVNEIQHFIQVFPLFFDKVSPSLRGLGFDAFQNFGNFLQAFKTTLDAVSSNIFSGLILFFGGVSSTLFVITTAFFLSLEERAIEKFILALFPKKYEAYALSLFERCEKRVSGWFISRLITCVFVGVLSYIAFLALGVNYPFTLALFAGVFNFIPYIGPFVSGLVIFLIVLPMDFYKGIFVLIAFLLIQEIEAHILSPILTKKIVGLPPALVLISLAIGGELWGFLGALMAVPLLGIIFEFAKEFLTKRRERETA